MNLTSRAAQTLRIFPCFCLQCFPKASDFSKKVSITTMNTLFTGLLVVVSCGLLLGCGSEPSEDGDRLLAEVELALGESTCATAATADAEIYTDYCGAEHSTSPNSSYGQTNCPGQYVVEFDGSVDFITGFNHAWGDTLPTGSACEHAHSYVSVWKFKNNGWTQLANAFHSVGVYGDYCTFEAPDVTLDADAELYRTATRAVQCPTSGLCYTPTVKKAWGYAFGTACKP